MASFLVRTNLSRGDLRLFLTNENGYAQDATRVLWTVFDPSGRQVSGRRIPAIRAAVGEYYAPWFSDVRNGNYSMRWEIQESSGSGLRSVTQPFFVVDPSSYETLNGKIPQGAVPVPGGFVFLTGTTTSRGDLPLFLKDDSGVPANASAVLWTIYDAAGNQVSPTTVANQAAYGEYFAAWFVNVQSGDYTIKWQFQRDQSSPLQSATMGFSVVNPSQPYALALPSCPEGGQEQFIAPTLILASVLANAGAATINVAPAGFPSISIVAPVVPVVSPIPSGGNDDFEIPRTVHLASQALPPSGIFTEQVPYNVPPLVRNVTFYISYTRGAPNGYAVFKLLWGNGQEEVQETTVSFDLGAPVGPSLAPPVAMNTMYLQALTGPMPPDNNPISFILYVGVPGGAKTVRLLAAEAGVPGAPGTVGITLTASTD